MSNNKQASYGNLLFWFIESIHYDLNEIEYSWNLKQSYLTIIDYNKSLSKTTDVTEKQYREIHYNQLRQITELYYKICVYLPTIVINKKNKIKKKWNDFIVTNYEKIQTIYPEIYSYYSDKLLYPKNNDEKRIVQILLEELQNTENMLIPLLPKKYTAKNLIKSVIEEPYKIMKSPNHILFVYDEDEANYYEDYYEDEYADECEDEDYYEDEYEDEYENYYADYHEDEYVDKYVDKYESQIKRGLY